MARPLACRSPGQDMPKDGLKDVPKDRPKGVPKPRSATKNGWRRSLRKKASHSPNCCLRRIKGQYDNNHTTPV